MPFTLRSAAQELTAERPFLPIFEEIEGAAFYRPLREDDAGSVWVISQSRQELAQFVDGDPRRLRKLAVPQPYRDSIKAFAHRLTAFLVMPGEEIWAGTGDGTTYRFRGGRWEKLSDPGPPRFSLKAEMRSDVTDFIFFHERMYAASVHLFFWEEAAREWKAQESLSAQNFARANWDELLVAEWGGGDVWRLRVGAEEESDRLWQGDTPDHRRTVLAADPAGRILVGTDDGLLTLDRQGHLLNKELRGLRITSVAVRPEGKLWVGTDEGLRYREGGVWHSYGFRHGLPSDRIEDVYIDGHGRLWTLAEYHLLSAPAAKAEADIKTLLASGGMSASIFPDASEAVKVLLGKRRVSGQISWDTLEGQAVVFFQGAQVYPDRHGHEGPNAYHRSSDGALLLLRFNGARFSWSCSPGPCSPESARKMASDWSAATVISGRRSEVPIPEPPPEETPGPHFLLDSKGRVWVGTSGSGVLCFDGKQWARHDNEAGVDGAVMALAEDINGNIWVGTSADYDFQLRRYRSKNLHRFDGRTWSHWSPEEGLAYWSLTALAARANGEMAAGTNGGLSILGGTGIQTYEHEAMLNRVYVDSISEDAEGWLWITHGWQSNSGVTWFDGKRFYNVTTRDGLFSDHLRASAHDASGLVWLLDDKGRVAVYSRDQFAAKQTPELMPARIEKN